MAITIKHGTWPSALREEVAPEQLSLIGYVDLEFGIGPKLKYPLPLLAINDHLVAEEHTTDEGQITRIQGLRPDHRETDVLVAGQWDAQVNLPQGQIFGEGSVYLGNATTPSDAKGVIFERHLPFVPDNELAFVTRPTPDVKVLAEDTFNEDVYKLVYAHPGQIRHMGQLALI